MGHTNGQAAAICVPEDWTMLADGDSLADPREAASKHELTAAEQKHEQDIAREVRNSRRRHALDRLLRVSFSTISPAYLFTTYPPLR
jgi:hypothetical protein